MKDRITPLLEQFGWTLYHHNPATGLASKGFLTAVGVKTAVLYLFQSGNKWVLNGDYQSEGRNVLSTSQLVFSNDITAQELEETVPRFLHAVEKTIGQTYAARLARSGGSSGMSL